MAFGLDDRRTIFALSSGFGKAAIAVVRISGPATATAIESLIGCLPRPREAAYRAIVDPRTKCVLDRGIVLWFPGPHSFTGEDSGELQVHGARAVVGAVLRVLGEQQDLRPAKPGEFTHRGLENGKLDLIAVEGLADLIDSETEQQRRFAIAQASGNLQDVAQRWRERLIDALVMIESELDFSDESETHSDAGAASRAIVLKILETLESLTRIGNRAERLREGMTVLIAGPPNAGKSTLLNAIAKRDVAIVSERAGTTRDLIEVRLDLDGFPVNLIDTAGIHVSEDPIEQEGIGRALRKSADADLILWLAPEGEVFGVPPEPFAGRTLWRVVTKADEAKESDDGQSEKEGELELSARTGRNIDKLIARVQTFAAENMSIEGSLVVANERQRHALSLAQDALFAALDRKAPLEVVAEELRRACFALESLMGKVGVEDVLDQLFSRFCIGK
jgi:tRNA modification GTPase